MYRPFIAQQQLQHDQVASCFSPLTSNTAKRAVFQKGNLAAMQGLLSRNRSKVDRIICTEASSKHVTVQQAAPTLLLCARQLSSSPQEALHFPVSFTRQNMCHHYDVRIKKKKNHNCRSYYFRNSGLGCVLFGFFMSWSQM